jgi:hypothetical protein
MFRAKIADRYKKVKKSFTIELLGVPASLIYQWLRSHRAQTLVSMRLSTLSVLQSLLIFAQKGCLSLFGI